MSAEEVAALRLMLREVAQTNSTGTDYALRCQRERDEARAQRDAAQRELHRLIHGAEIEGDGVCEHELRANEAHASWLHWQRQYAEAARERDELREARDEARAQLASTRAAALREAADIARAHGGISAYYAIRKLAAEVEP